MRERCAHETHNRDTFVVLFATAIFSLWMRVLLLQRVLWWKRIPTKPMMERTGGGEVTSPLSVDVGGMRADYRNKLDTFLEKDLEFKDPIRQFKVWFEEACKTPGILEANAMCLSTASRDGVPSGRFLLMKGFGDEGFTFYTNYTSRKGKELEENPKAALTFYWEPLQRSVRVEGSVQKVPDEESDGYFQRRPRGSQIGALMSKQSAPVASRDVLREREEMFTRDLGDCKEMQRPSHWGGYRVIPERVEFWQGQSNRIHDRICFRRPQSGEIPDGTLLHQGEKGWLYERLYP